MTVSCDQCGKSDFPTQAFVDLHKGEGLCVGTPKSIGVSDSEGSIQGVGRLQLLQADPDYLIEPDVYNEISRVITLCQQEPQNIMITGPAGSGKTSLSKQIAALRATPTLITNASNWRSSDEVFGREVIRLEKDEHGGVHSVIGYEPSLLVEALETPQATIIINDLALMQNKTIQNGLNDLLDPSVRFVYVDQMMHTLGRPVRVAPGVLICATWNEGVEYTGNIKLSHNLKSRFMNRVYMDYPPLATQVEVVFRKTGLPYDRAKKICQYAEVLRKGTVDQIEMDMRSILQAARKLVAGANMREALLFSFIAGLPLEGQTKALQALDGFLSVEEKDQIATSQGDNRKWVAWGDLHAKGDADAA